MTAKNIDTFTGWTVGAGIEYSLSPAWSLKAEYLHFDFGNQAFAVSNEAATVHVREALTADSMKAGVNYHIGQGYEPLK